MHYLFDTAVEKVCKIWEVTDSDLFSKSRKTNITEARQVLYFYLWYHYDMTQAMIQQQCSRHGLDVHHSSIAYAIKKLNKLYSEKHGQMERRYLYLMMENLLEDVQTV